MRHCAYSVCSCSSEMHYPSVTDDMFTCASFWCVIYPFPIWMISFHPKLWKHAKGMGEKQNHEGWMEAVNKWFKKGDTIVKLLVFTQRHKRGRALLYVLLYHQVAALFFNTNVLLTQATNHYSPLSTPELHNRRIPFFSLFCPSPLLILLPWESHHSSIPLSAPFLALSPCANHCLWWIIHSVQWGLKLFDWQLYSPISYIINTPLSGIVAMAKAITGQRRVSCKNDRLPQNTNP